MLLFICYSRHDRERVETLAADFGCIGHDVWLDQKLTGGQMWWDQVLAKIRDCDLFVLALTPYSLDSQACQLEYGYAFSLSKRVLPILLADGVSMNLLPPALASIQVVDYRSQDRKSAFTLTTSLANLPAAQPLPQRLPRCPDPPMSYLGSLRQRIEGAEPLGFPDQAAVLVDLKASLRKPDDAADARTLLGRLRRRQDLFERIADEIDSLLAVSVPATHAGSQVAPVTPAPRTMDIAVEATTGVASVELVEKGRYSTTILCNGHTIKMGTTGKGPYLEYDEKEVLWTWFERLLGRRPRSSFVVVEEGEQVLYECRHVPPEGLDPWVWFELRRNGVVIFHG